MIRGAACNYYAAGVDGLYLSHWFNNWPYEATFYEKLRELPHPEVMAPKSKIVYIPTETGRYSGAALINSLEPGLTMQLPRSFHATERAPSSDSGTPSAELAPWRAAEIPGRCREYHQTQTVCVLSVPAI